MRPTRRASGSQGLGQFASEFSTALNAESLVDRLVDHVHLRPAREGGPQSLADPFRAPAQGEVVLDEVPQLGVRADLPPSWGVGAARRSGEQRAVGRPSACPATTLRCGVSPG